MCPCAAMNADGSAPAQPSPHTVPMTLAIPLYAQMQQRTATYRVHVQHTTTAMASNIQPARVTRSGPTPSRITAATFCAHQPSARRDRMRMKARASAAARFVRTLSYHRLAHTSWNIRCNAPLATMQRPQPCHTTRTREDTGRDAACNRWPVPGARALVVACCSDHSSGTGPRLRPQQRLHRSVALHCVALRCANRCAHK